MKRKKNFSKSFSLKRTFDCGQIIVLFQVCTIVSDVCFQNPLHIKCKMSLQASVWLHCTEGQKQMPRSPVGRRVCTAARVISATPEHWPPPPPSSALSQQSRPQIQTRFRWKPPKVRRWRQAYRLLFTCVRASPWPSSSGRCPWRSRNGRVAGMLSRCQLWFRAVQL